MKDQEQYVLVVDRMVSAGEPKLAQGLLTLGYPTQLGSRHQDHLQHLEQHPRPAVACFEYDYPNVLGLAQLRETKQRYPAIPLLMVTLEHSEELAIWAFRNRVFDFFSHPIDWARFSLVLSTLHAMRQGPGAVQRNPTLWASAPPPPGARAGGELPLQRKLHTAISYMERHFHEKILQCAVADACDMSTFGFSRAFRDAYGITFQEYLLRLRLEKAAEFLCNPNMSVTSAGMSAGFRDSAYFSRVFHKRTGMRPSEYKLRMRNGAMRDTQGSPHPAAAHGGSAEGTGARAEDTPRPIPADAGYLVL